MIACPRAIDLLAFDFTTFFSLDKRMEAIVRIGGAATVVRAEDSPITLRAGQMSLLRWIRYGMFHIYSGIDHISFVLALLLVVMLRRDGTRWSVKPFVATLRATATVVTAFTIAHSVTLISAALGWVSLPSRLVESLIALSIAYTAAENIAKPDVRWRYALTFRVRALARARLRVRARGRSAAPRRRAAAALLQCRRRDRPAHDRRRGTPALLYERAPARRRSLPGASRCPHCRR